MDEGWLDSLPSLLSCSPPLHFTRLLLAPPEPGEGGESRDGGRKTYLAGVAITHAVASWVDRFPSGPMWGLWGDILGSLQLPWVSPFLLQPL